jgi:hypothetical protein
MNVYVCVCARIQVYLKLQMASLSWYHAAIRDPSTNYLSLRRKLYLESWGIVIMTRPL